jgi:predicted nucleic acid-binding Zn ribbon protein
MKRNCAVCGVELKTTDMRVKMCPAHRGVRTRAGWNRHPLYCRVCNKPIEIGSGRKYYCSDECRRVNINRREVERNKTRRRGRALKTLAVTGGLP